MLSNVTQYSQIVPEKLDFGVHERHLALVLFLPCHTAWHILEVPNQGCCLCRWPCQ